jgi:hypothetical protein
MIINFQPFIETKIQKHIGALMIFFSFIPWIHFGLNNRDSQPWALLFSAIFIFFSTNLKFSRDYLLIAFIPFTSIFVWLFFSEQIFDFIALRAVISYLTFSICLLGFLIYLREYGFPWKILIFINILYLLIGIIQLFIPDIVSSIVQSRGLGQSGRGVTSLAPEPTYYGIFLYLISYIFLIKNNFKFSAKDPISILIICNILSIIFLAKSSMVIFYLIVSLAFFIISRLSFKQTFGVILLFFSISIFGYFFLKESRIFSIISTFYDIGLINIIYLDESINDRVANVIYPLHGAYINNFLPSGFHSFTNMHSYLNDFYNGFFHFGNGSTSIMSFMGVFIYELGFIGIIILFLIFLRMQDGSFKRFMDTSLIFVILNSSVPPSFPLVPFIFAIYFLKPNINSKNYKKHTINKGLTIN